MKAIPKVITTVQEIREWRRSEQGAQIGFVPTMGALHRGHAALLGSVRPRCDISVLSIFVNPKQFAPHEDLDRYPRSFNEDLQIAAEQGVDIVFAPTADELYPKGFSTFIEETRLSLPLCGPFRPGHFRGVTTIVLKLFNLIQPQLAFFGLKDAQQFYILKHMTDDLNLEIQVEGIDTIREPDGLALSSRNIYLSPEEREIAPLIYQTLKQLKNKTLEPDLEPQNYYKNLNENLAIARQTLNENGFKLQYLDCFTLPHFEAISSLTKPNDSLIFLIAGYLGKTRLIDNIYI